MTEKTKITKITKQIKNKSIMAKPLVETKARVGVFSIALQAYLPQFPQLVPEFEAQYAAFKKTLPDTIEIVGHPADADLLYLL